MDVLCFDVASGGVSGARFDENLNLHAHAEADWNLTTLTAANLQATFRTVFDELKGNDPPAAISIASFMHGFLVVDGSGMPVTPVFTWLDTADAVAVERVKSRLGDQFHQRTGCKYHPMFPVFKLAAIKVSPSQRVVSPKAWLLWTLTGKWSEDYGMASASGLLNIHSAQWDSEILRIIDLPVESLSELSDRETVVGRFQGTPVLNGSGDGFLATLGSGCESAGRVAVSLGTTASAREFVAEPVLNDSSGTFCYRAQANRYLLGCAGNNGGNVLEWARRVFGPLNNEQPIADIPIFLPMLHGERSPDWNSRLRASFHDVTHATTADAVKQAAVEGVVFNLAHYVEILEATSQKAARQVILSGNGFREPSVPRILASLVRADVLMPPAVGLATLRGAAISAWRALGQNPGQSLEGVLGQAERVAPLADHALIARYGRYKQLRVRTLEL